MEPRLSEAYENQPSIYRDVQRALWFEWDPIGLKEMDEEWPNTEYDGYAAQVLSLLNRTTSDRELGAALGKIEVEQMGIERSEAELTEAARRIMQALNWKDPRATT